MTVAATLEARSEAACDDEAAAHATRLLAAGRADLARPLLSDLAARPGAPPSLRLNHALAVAATGEAARARGLLTAIAAAWPAWAEPHVRLAESFRADGDFPRARDHYGAALSREPDRAEALVALGALLVLDGRAGKAIAPLRRAVAKHPGRAEAWDALGRALAAAADRPGAAAALAVARRLAPSDAGVALRAAEAAHAAGLGEAALAVPARVDDGGVSLAARGCLLIRAHRLPEAADALEAACALGADTAEVLALLGGALTRLGRNRRAERSFRRALDAAPGAPELSLALSTTLIRQHRFREARRLLATAIAAGATDAALFGNLSSVETSLGEQDAAAASAEQAIAAAPAATAGRRALLNVLPYRHGTNASDLLAAARACAATLAPAAPPPPFANTRDPERSLRVGLLSGGLRTHPVGWLTVAGLEALDPEHFAVAAFAQSPGAPPAGDPIAARFRALARGGWHAIESRDDAAAARLIRDAAIDVLIDLGGHGDHGRIGVCAHRAAPVQVKWVGSQTHSTGLAAMDFFLTDFWESPPGAEAGFSERLLRLPDGYVCYAPPVAAPAVAPPPALARGFVTFGCFNNLSKITPAALDAWAAILARVPSARFAFKTHQFDEPETVDSTREKLAARGVDPGRVDCLGMSAHHAHLAAYGGIDVALDPFPYAGGLTTIEALWMGVPTVALAGDFFASRHSVSHLSNVGLSDWVTTSVEGYVARAVAAAADVSALAALRAHLRTTVAASPLCDAPRFGRSLGAALRHAWQAWCARR